MQLDCFILTMYSVPGRLKSLVQSKTIVKQLVSLIPKLAQVEILAITKTRVNG